MRKTPLNADAKTYMYENMSVEGGGDLQVSTCSSQKMYTKTRQSLRGTTLSQQKIFCMGRGGGGTPDARRMETKPKQDRMIKE